MARIPLCELLGSDINRVKTQAPLENTVGDTEPVQHERMLDELSRGKLSLERFKSRLLDLFSPIYRALGSKEAPAAIALRASAGRLRAELEKEADALIMPLAHLLEKMGRAGIELEFFERYLYAKHTLYAPPDMPPTGMTQREAENLISEYERLSPEQKAIIDEAESILKQVRTREIRIRIEGGLLPPRIKGQDTVEYLESKYPNYVPLWDLDEDIGPKPLLGYGPLGFDLKRANEYYRREGRQTYARGSLIARFIKGLEQAIVRKHKNLVLQEVIEELSKLGFARIFVEKYLPADSTGRRYVPYVAIKGVIENPLAVSRPPDGAIIDRENKIIEGGTEFNTFLFKKEGLSFYAYVPDQDIARSLRRMNLLSLMFAYDYSSIVGFLNRFTTIFRQLATSYNPTFIVRNFLRDQAGAFLKSFMEFGASGPRHWIRASAKALRAAWRYHVEKDRTSELAREFEQFRLLGGITGFYSRSMDIGETGKQLKKYYERGLRGKLSWQEAFYRMGQLLGKIQEFNTTVEEAVRYAAYIVAKKEGKSEKEAILIARNITVDFNRQGEYGSILSSFYAFFNARLQGAYNLIEYLTDDGPRGKRARLVAAYLAGLGFLWAMMTRILMGPSDDGDDEEEALGDGRKPLSWAWDKIPMFIRMNHIVIPVPDEENHLYVRLPLPPGPHVFWAAGIAAESIAHAMGSDVMPESEKTRELFRAGWALVDAVIDGFSPVSGGSVENPAQFALLSFSPTIIRPLSEVAINSNFFGSPVYPDPELNRAKPVYELAWRRTSIWARELSRGLHEFLGIESPFFSPAALEHIVRGYTSGVGTFVANTIYTVERLFMASRLGQRLGSEDLSRLPVISSFTGTEPEYVVYREYYDLRDELANISMRMKMLQAGVRGRAYELTPDEIRYYHSVRAISSNLESAVRRYRDMIKKIELARNMSEKEKVERISSLEKEMLRTMRRHNRLLIEAKLKIEKGE